MNIFIRSSEFEGWLTALKDAKGKARIFAQVDTEKRHRACIAYGARAEGDEDMKVTYAPFDVADYLDSDEVIAEHLTAAAEDPNPEVFLAALGDVAKAKGMAQIAKDAGLGRESRYKTFGAGAHPRYETVSAVLRALGVKLTVSVVAEKRRPTRGENSRTRVAAPPPKQRQRVAVARG
jgi:probable addiction module antidote protein